MGDRERTARKDRLEQIMSAFGATSKSAETLEFARLSSGQRYPSPCPESYSYPAAPEVNATHTTEDRLGAAMNIGQVARLLGCSVWTVRQRYMPQGLPHLRVSAVGKIVFFRSQVIDWILKQQTKKGGNRL